MSSQLHNIDRTVRFVRAGGITKSELLAQFDQAQIQLNQAAHELFADERFITSTTSYLLETIECSVAELGLPQGGTCAKIIDQATMMGLSVCPLEVAPHLRLEFTDQAEGYIGYPKTLHQAPPGSLTVASELLALDTNSLRGFYLRCIEGVLWLRGYRCGADYIWSPEDMFIFSRTQPGENNGNF